jgi:Skp family chaperone for outer membrane proteins
MSKDLIDPTEAIAPGRLLEALERSTRESAELRGRVEVLEHTLSELEESIDERMGRLETQMTSSNAHLDNISRETARTNELLEADLADRKADREEKKRMEKEERERNQKLQDDFRESMKKAAKEVWEVFKQPFGFLVAGIVAWVVYMYFGVDRTIPLPLPQPQSPIPALETHPEK